MCAWSGIRHSKVIPGSDTWLSLNIGEIRRSHVAPLPRPGSRQRSIDLQLCMRNNLDCTVWARPETLSALVILCHNATFALQQSYSPSVRDCAICHPMHTCCVLAWVKSRRRRQCEALAQELFDSMPHVQHVRLLADRVTLTCVRQMCTTESQTHRSCRYRCSVK